MNGVTGRMGTNQHLVRSINAIRAQGGVPLADGRTIMPDPILVGRNAGKVQALAQEHHAERWTTDLDAAMSYRDATIYPASAPPAVRPSVSSEELVAVNESLDVHRVSL